MGRSAPGNAPLEDDMEQLEIVVKQRGNASIGDHDYIAYVVSREDLWEIGRTAHHALGRLVALLEVRGMVNITISKEE